MKKIIVVGGGSAGWMTAATLIKHFPDKNITLIEAPNSPIVGVGESTLGGIKQWVEFLGIDEKDAQRWYRNSLDSNGVFDEGQSRGASSLLTPAQRREQLSFYQNRY